MELWEGAILLVGGVWLVGYMSQKNAQASQANAAAAAASTTIVPTVGTSNTSNLTSITNMAGGTPTTYGEPLEPPQPPLIKGACPAWGCNGPPAATAYPIIARSPISTSPLPPRIGPPVSLPVRGTPMRPIEVAL